MPMIKVIGCLIGVVGLALWVTPVVRACSTEHMSPLAAIVISGTVEELAKALEAGADVNETNDFGLNLLMLATFDESRGAAKAEMLLRAGADPHGRAAEGDTVLHFAAGQGEVRILELLLDYGVYVNGINDFKETPLMVAIRSSSGSLEKVKLLLKEGADPARQDYFGRTALHLAATAGWSEAIELLLSAGAEAEVRERNGLTP